MERGAATVLADYPLATIGAFPLPTTGALPLPTYGGGRRGRTEIGREGGSSLYDSESQWGFHYLGEIHHGDSERYRGPEGQKLFHVSPPLSKEHSEHHTRNFGALELVQKSHNRAPTDLTGGEPQCHCYDGSSAAGARHGVQNQGVGIHSRGRKRG